MREQQTVAATFRLSGVGLHHGLPAELVVEPAPPSTGLVFVREDAGGLEIPALQHFRSAMVHATRLERDGVAIDTPEHLLAALYALGVDNARMRLTSSEVPILDGSALPFAHAVLEAGIETQDVPREQLVVTRSVVVEDDDRRLEIHPYDGFKLTAAIDFEHRSLGYQELTLNLDREDEFLHKLAPARTFALKRDVDRLREMGLARGGTLDNAVVVGDDGVLGGELRFPDEFVRHKLLDLVGDLALIGCGVRGRMVAWRSGHAFHGRLVDAILSDRRSWVYEPAAGQSEPPARPTPPGRVRVG
ncbi:MAG: UDP-3-O-acyl-N-acetylglucosamine deacetylase [Acidobacteriota bacterium]|nr:UDP-3-O-acyl-N-acetylglucosamine deacetylase [Acidobacteriota bacterium]